MTPEQIIDWFDMKPLPKEGGFYAETYRAPQTLDATALPGDCRGPRSISTSILYLLIPDMCSALHRLASDEIWHFYLGDPVTMLQLHPDGSSETFTLGPDILAGQSIQLLVPAHTWQGSFLDSGGSFALLGCTVAPGFDFDDYEHADRDTLLARYPDRADLIRRLTL